MENQNEEPIVSYLTMRKAVGWIGMLLPFLLLGGNIILNQAGIFDDSWFVKGAGAYHNSGSWKSSVSHYYYTTVGEYFTGALCAVAMFMLCYKGHAKRPGDKGLSDNMMTTIAGLLALGIVSFPTTSDEVIKDNLRSFISSDTIGWIHYVFAGTFFVVLAVMSMENFRRSNKLEDFGKGPDDPFYLWCGRLILVWLLLVPVCAQFPILFENHSTFILEALALMTFGISWLRKGRADFKYLPRLVGLVK
jgi:hypothetical protein